MVTISVKRVVSIFILRPATNHQRHNTKTCDIALFHRCATMPTFPNHWAGISGSIEEDDVNPFEAAVRELQEETNLLELFAKYNGDNENGTNKDTASTSLRSCINQGLHVDVSSNNSKGAFGGRIIRVYPFALTLPTADGKSTQQTNEDCDTSSIWSLLEMEGTEHDRMKFVNIKQFLEMKDPCVPSLKLAFHHATCGSYLELPKDIRNWEQDRENGAAFLTQKAVVLLAAHHANTATNNNDNTHDTEQPNVALSIAMLRPSMVPIVNAMKEFDCRIQQSQDYNKVRDELLHSLDDEIEKCVDLAVEDIVRYHKEWEQSASSFDKANGYTIGTFSRSSTMKKILKQVLRVHLPSANIKVLCSRSTPGNEGEIMATDICANWLPDDSFKKEIRLGKINLVLVGADCILQDGNGVVNKVGTAELAACCKQSNVPIICCADKWKLWKDIYPPALEDIFEVVPSETIDHVLVPVDGKNDTM